ncbi:VOC family protein [Streptomyces sp. NPDC046977]|uniref:VOC family protein n=1 Tax=Streptomyces sp. NPDC046977 TaxID=3154703 RepID=UPI0033F10F3A
MTVRIGLIEIVVADMGASLAFYRRLGLEIAEGVEGEPHVEAELPGGLRMAWDTRETVRSFDPAWTPPGPGGHGTALAFACDDPAEVDAVFAELTAAGYEGHLKPFDAVWGMRYATVRDPDGNAVDLYAQLS